MPRSMLNTESVFVNPLCRAPSPPARPVTQVGIGGYLELHGTEADWRLRVRADGALVMEKKISGLWMTRSRAN